MLNRISSSCGKSIVKIINTMRRTFYPAHSEVTDLVKDGEMKIQRYFRTSKVFYGTAFYYLEARNKPVRIY
jgi:hypothetical protein